MMKKRKLIAACALVLAACSTTQQAVPATGEDRLPTHVEVEQVEDAVVGLAAVDSEAIQSVRFIRYAEAVTLIEYVEAVEHAKWHEAQAAKAAAKAKQQATVQSAPAVSGDVWYRLAMCETGGKMDNPNTGNGFYGYFQFKLSTWQGVGGPGYPHHHSYETQLVYAKKLQARDGWSPWPTCARKLGLL